MYEYTSKYIKRDDAFPFYNGLTIGKNQMGFKLHEFHLEKAALFQNIWYTIVDIVNSTIHGMNIELAYVYVCLDAFG